MRSLHNSFRQCRARTMKKVPAGSTEKLKI
jgi:hypothetical protein